MSKIRELKEALKALAAEIRQTKAKLKDYQRENNGYQGGFLAAAETLSWTYRHKHIAYCLLRGTPYERIESPADGNEPDQETIQEVLDAYKENVRACA